MRHSTLPAWRTRPGPRHAFSGEDRCRCGAEADICLQVEGLAVFACWNCVDRAVSQPDVRRRWRYREAAPMGVDVFH